MNSYIKSVGVYYPTNIRDNNYFNQINFLKKNCQSFNKPSEEVVKKFEEITEIQERKIADCCIAPSDMGYYAANDAITNGNINKEEIDYIIVAHNWGDVYTNHNYSDLLPNLAARIKGKLQIKNPNCVAYDILFGCPGWIEGLKQADLLIKAEEAERVLVIGTDAVSRVVESCDVDSMLFSDGAGCVILEKTEDSQKGILAYKTLSHTEEELSYLKMDNAYDPLLKDSGLYLKMDGKKVYRYAMENVPVVISHCIEKLGLSVEEIKYLLIHQANGKMIRMMAEKLFHMYHKELDEDSLLINVNKMGNNSVATVPTLLFELVNKKLNSRGVQDNDCVVFASVGAGMHANALIYRF